MEFLPWQDSVAALCWLIANALLLWLALTWAQRLFPEEHGSALLLHTTVLYLAAVIGLVTLTGALGLLSGPAILSAATGLIGGSWWGLRWLEPAAHRAARRGPSAPLSPPGSARSWVWLWTGAGALLAAHIVLDGLLRFPSDYDSLMYHIPLIDHWIQTGGLYAPQSANWSLAANNEILGVWMTAPFSGDFLIGMNNLPVAVLWAIASFQLCRLVGLPHAWSHCVTLATLLVHPLWHQTDDAANDVAVVAFFLAGGCYCLRYLQTRRRIDLILCGACIGLLAGVKYYALGYAAVLAGTLVCGLWAERHLRSSMRGLALALAVSFLLGGYWYLRNWIAGGSPLYPVGASGAVSGLGYASLWQTTFVGNGHPQLLELGLSAVWSMTGIWHSIAVLLTPLIAIYLWGTPLRQMFFRQRAAAPASIAPASGRDAADGASPQGAARGFADAQHKWQGLVHLILYFWLVGSAAVLAVTPFALEDQPGTLNHLRWAYTPVRYGLCYLSIVSISLGLLLCNIAVRVPPMRPRVRLDRAMVAVIAILALWQMLQVIATTRDEFSHTSTALLALGLGLAGWLASSLVYQLSWRDRALAGGVLVLALSLGIGWLSHRWHRGLGEHFDRHFASDLFGPLNASPASERILVLDSRPYPFFGSRRQHWITNPRSAGTAEELARIAAADDLTLFSTRIDNGAYVDRYRGALEMLQSGQPQYERVAGRGKWHLFRRQQSNPSSTDPSLMRDRVADRPMIQPAPSMAARQESLSRGKGQ